MKSLQGHDPQCCDVVPTFPQTYRNNYTTRDTTTTTRTTRDTTTTTTTTRDTTTTTTTTTTTMKSLRGHDPQCCDVTPTSPQT